MKERAFNLFAVALQQLIGSVQALGVKYVEKPNIDIIVDVKRYDLQMPDILCERCNSYSQHGEDIIIDSLLRAAMVEPSDRPMILELGSNHPVNMSNTWMLYQRGFRSVLVDANPRYEHDTLKSRPEDIFLCAGVATDDARTATLYVPQHAEVASLSLSFVLSWYERRGWCAEIEEIEVELYSINDIFLKYFTPPGPVILAIDIEGLDFQILQSIDWENWKPPIICIERDRRERSSAAARGYLKERGYTITAATAVNDIFLLAS